jgi:hypothetical protein
MEGVMLIQPVCAECFVANVQICHPKYLSAREMQAILNDPRLFAALDEPVIVIMKNDNGYLVCTESYEMQVDVTRVPPLSGLIGGYPVLHLDFHAPKFSSIHCQALHPKYETAREILAILNDCRLFEKLGNEVIQGIQKTEEGYVVLTRSSEINVDVIVLPPTPGIIGEPTRFDLVFHDPVYSLTIS